MKLVIISDTHGLHERMFCDLPDGDILIHCGDVCNVGYEWEYEDFFDWFSARDYEHRIFIGGNHDKFLYDIRDRGPFSEEFDGSTTHYLLDSALSINGVKFWGSPWTPTFYDWYFMKDRGSDIRERWELIPDNTDILITHGPPMGVLDLVGNENVGCADIVSELDRVSPKLHCFGHIHEGFGVKTISGTTFVNASICDASYIPRNEPIIFDLPAGS